MNIYFYFPTEITHLFSSNISIFYSMVSKTTRYISFNSYIKNYDVNSCISKLVDFDEFIEAVSIRRFYRILINNSPLEVP